MERIKKYLIMPQKNEHLLEKYIDRKLFARLKIFFIVIMLLMGLMAYDVLDGILAIDLAFLGLVFGLLPGFAASRIFLIYWHEESAKVVSRLDAIGAVILLFYIIFALSRKWIFGTGSRELHSRLSLSAFSPE